MLGLITDSVIEDFLVVLEQAFNPSKVVVAVSGAGETRGDLKRLAAVTNLRQVLLVGRAALTLLRPESKKVEMEARGPEWVGWSVRLLEALNSGATACGGDPEGSRHCCLRGQPSHCSGCRPAYKGLYVS